MDAVLAPVRAEDGVAQHPRRYSRCTELPNRPEPAPSSQENRKTQQAQSDTHSGCRYRERLAEFMSLPHINSDENRGRKRPLQPQQEDRAASSSLSSSSAGGSPRTFERQNRNGPAAQNNSYNNNDDEDTNNTNIDNHDPYGEGSDIFDAASLPNDTMATVLALQTEFFGAGRNSALDGGRGGSGQRTGVVLQHQM